jgi:hypothetical protein
MLCLGYIECEYDSQNNCIITIIDDKKPWYLEMMEGTTGNTEIDGSELLPYLINIKGKNDSEYPDDPNNPDDEGTIDIGWAIDFHHHVGNHVNYDIRLHTDKFNDDKLYINGSKLLSELPQNSPSNPEDPVDIGDVYLDIGNNITITDSYDANIPTANPNSDSGKACYSIKVKNKDTNNIITTSGASWCLLADGTSSIGNRSDFYNPSSVINEMQFTTTPDKVTINGEDIWHTGNLISTGINIMFVGYSEIDPTQSPDGSQLVDGDTYYNTLKHVYYYYANGSWTQVGSGSLAKQYEVIATDGQTSIICEYNPDFIWIGVNGSHLPKGDYVAIDGEVIIFNNPLSDGDIVSIFTVLGSSAISGRLSELSDVSITNLQDGDSVVWDEILNKWVNQPNCCGGGAPLTYYTPSMYTSKASDGQDIITTTYNPSFVQVYINGIELNQNDYTSTDGNNIVLLYPLSTDDDIKVLTVLEEGSSTALTMSKYLFTATDGQTDFTCDYNSSFINVVVDGISIPPEKYQATDGSVVSLVDSQIAETPVEIYTIKTGGNIDGVRFNSCLIVAAEGQTTFNCNYNVDYIEVSRNGIITPSDKYTADNGSTVIFDDPLTENETVQITTIFNGSALNANRITRYETDIEEEQSVFDIGGFINKPKVYINGIRIRDSLFDIENTNNNIKITLNNPAQIGDWILIEE